MTVLSVVNAMTCNHCDVYMCVYMYVWCSVIPSSFVSLNKKLYSHWDNNSCISHGCQVGALLLLCVYSIHLHMDMSSCLSVCLSALMHVVCMNGIHVTVCTHQCEWLFLGRVEAISIIN